MESKGKPKMISAPNGNENKNVKKIMINGHAIYYDRIEKTISTKERLTDREFVKLYNYMVREGFIK